MRILSVFILAIFFSQPLLSSESNEELSNKLIKAEKAHANKKFNKSTSLAKKALNQSKMAIEQHNSQKDNYRFLDD